MHKGVFLLLPYHVVPTNGVFFSCTTFLAIFISWQKTVMKKQLQNPHRRRHVVMASCKTTTDFHYGATITDFG